MTDYTYEILKILYNNNGKLDISILIDNLTKDLPDEEKRDIKQKIAGIIVTFWDAEKKFIQRLSIPEQTEFSNRYSAHRINPFQNDDIIELEIRSEGIEEYHRLDKIYNPLF